MEEDLRQQADALRREVALLKKKLARSEVNRSRAEKMMDETEALHENVLDRIAVQKRSAEANEARIKLVLRSREAAEEALRQAKQEAEAATRAKGDFLARMSHEIRTPMNAVIGLTHLALRTELTPKQTDYLRKICSSSQALLGIINDILDFYKIEAGKLTLESIHFNLQDVLANLANVITMKAAEKGLEILFSLDDRVPLELVGDPLRLGQVLLNLSANAVKFTERGEVVISTRLVAEAQGEVRVRLSVRDTGIGMTEKQMVGLFESFHQADGSITRRFGGTGLGLAISDQLVRMMDGTISVESTPGVGTCFSFEIPLRSAESQPANRRVLPEALLGLHVLVVDDNETARKILRGMLESFSLQVQTAESGEEAIALLEQRAQGANRPPFGLVLMDWKMEGLDGIETAARIKKAPHIPNTPAILMVSAYECEEVIERAASVGLDGFLSKPVGQSLLFNMILDTFDCQQDGVSRKRRASGLSASDLRGIRGARVLLVEDNPINQQVATELLQQAGLVVDLASDGREGVTKACAAPYDLVLMDVQMPEMDGLEATRRIRANGLTDLPIVAMTAHAMAGDRQRSLDAGMNDHLTKPIYPEALEEQLIRWIPEGDREPPDPRPCRTFSSDVALPEIQGLDTTLGVDQVGGSPDLYVDLLETFLARTRDAAEQIETARALGNREVAERLAHSVRGASASLGATPLAEAAGTLEAALRAGQEAAADQLVPRFRDALESLCLGLERYLAGRRESGSSEQPVVTDHEQATRLLARLIPLLEEGSSKAEKIVGELRAVVAGLDLDALLDDLEENVEDVEFAAALKIAGELTIRIEGSA